TGAWDGPHHRQVLSAMIEARAMTAQLIDGKAVAARIEAEVREELARTGLTPGLTVLRVGHDPASEIYVRNQATEATELGYAGGSDAPPGLDRRAGGGRPCRRRRPQRHRRQADGGAARTGQCHSDDLPLEDARSALDHPPGRHRRGRHRAPPLRHGGDGETG